MGTLTIIAYRKNKVVCSLGYLRADESHDSELVIRTFKTDESAVDTYLEMTLLDDLRKEKENPEREPIEFTFLVDGSPINKLLMQRRLEDAGYVAERMFLAEETAARKAEERERAARTEAEVKAKRTRDLAELQRILNTYPVQELRDSLTEFKL